MFLPAIVKALFLWFTLLTLQFPRGTLSKVEKLDYINAVKCLQSRPARTPASKSSGARTRFDDFVATHINQTLTIHYTVSVMG